MKKFFIVVIAIMMLVARPAAAQEEKSLLEIIEDDERLQTLVAAIQTTELIDTFLGEGPYTVFAPTDDAFNTLPEGTLQSLLLDPSTLTQILSYHIVSDELMTEQLAAQNGEEISTLQGENIMIMGDGENIMINDANMIVRDIQTSNGVIHLIDKVLIPPSVAATLGSSEEPPLEPTAELEPTPEPAPPTLTPELVLTPTPEPPPPSTVPDTGADKSLSLPLMPALMIVSGLFLLVVGYILRQPSSLE